MLELNKIYNMDCLEGMKMIDDKNIDMILCDLPYGTTKCEWDKVIPFEPLWEQYNRIIKDNGAIVLFSAQPFTTDLINSNRKMFRYEIIWKKTQKTGFYNVNRMPLRAHENICVFYKHLPTYNPQMYTVERRDIGRIRKQSANRATHYGNIGASESIETGQRYPCDVVEFSNWNGALFGDTSKASKHPTQKPVSICKNLILTYTNSGDTVLDNCIGSGSTAIGCLETGRNFIGFENNEEIYNTGNQRILNHMLAYTE